MNYKFGLRNVKGGLASIGIGTPRLFVVSGFKILKNCSGGKF